MYVMSYSYPKIETMIIWLTVSSYREIDKFCFQLAAQKLKEIEKEFLF